MTALTVIGVGNPLFGDDGVGIAVIEALRAAQLDMELIDGGTDALGLLEYFPNRKHLVIVDAARMGEKPGTVRCFDPAEADLILKWDHLSLHGVGLAEAWQLASKLDMLPEKMWVIGVQPGVVKMTNHLSFAVKNAVPKVVELIQKIVRYEDAFPCNESIKDNPVQGFSKEVPIHG